MRNKSKRLLIKSLYICIDIVFICLSVYVACWIRQTTLSFPLTLRFLLIDPGNPFRFIFLFGILSTILFNNAHGLYSTKREIIESLEVWEVFKSVMASSLVMIVIIYLVKIEGFPRSILVLIVFLEMFFLSLWRVAKRLFVRYLVSQGYNNFNVLVIGAGKIGKALVDEIRKKPWLGIRVIGFLDDFKVNDANWEGPKILGKLSDFLDIARKEFIEEIFITIHHDSNVFLKLLESAKQLNVAVRVVPQGFDLTSGEFSKYNIGFIPILEYSNSQQLRKQAGKRLFDFLMSAIASVVLFPFFVLLGLFIKIDSPGPVLYKSRRYGRGGKTFDMYKFRSMVQDADAQLEKIRCKNEVDGPIFKIRKDPRVTRMGSFLRKYSLDEFPQIINVLKGEMSLVGPRPFPIAQIEKEDLRQLKRLEVRPGITGLWQIRGRSDISFAKLIKWDIWYINNWSFWLDWNILLQTVPVVLKGKGAY